MSVTDLRKMSESDLDKELLELRREQFNLRMQQGTGQLANVSRFKQLRRDIARLKTVMNERPRDEQ